MAYGDGQVACTKYGLEIAAIRHHTHRVQNPEVSQAILAPSWRCSSNTVEQLSTLRPESVSLAWPHGLLGRARRRNYPGSGKLRGADRPGS